MQVTFYTCARKCRIMRSLVHLSVSELGKQVRTRSLHSRCFPPRPSNPFLPLHGAGTGIVFGAALQVLGDTGSRARRSSRRRKAPRSGRRCFALAAFSEFCSSSRTLLQVPTTDRSIDVSLNGRHCQMERYNHMRLRSLPPLRPRAGLDIFECGV